MTPWQPLFVRYAMIARGDRLITSAVLALMLLLGAIYMRTLGRSATGGASVAELEQQIATEDDKPSAQTWSAWPWN
jgi:hypothetical protein